MAGMRQVKVSKVFFSRLNLVLVLKITTFHSRPFQHTGKFLLGYFMGERLLTNRSSTEIAFKVSFGTWNTRKTCPTCWYGNANENHNGRQNKHVHRSCCWPMLFLFNSWLFLGESLLWFGFVALVCFFYILLSRARNSQSANDEAATRLHQRRHKLRN